MLADNEQLLHVLDLPQLYTRPSFEALYDALKLLKLLPSSFSTAKPSSALIKVDPDGVPQYLTSIVSSSLSWLEDIQREQIWDAASARLSERSGRNAMSNITRPFSINEDLTIELFEPSLTEDNLGLKTWTSSLLLARRLPSFRDHLASNCDHILELGSGTGLVGIAASVILDVNVTLTDLPEIVPNLQKNVDSNSQVLPLGSRELHVQALDWSDDSHAPASKDGRFALILAADPIYSSDHPRMLVEAVTRWIQYKDSARFIVELPLRQGYQKERDDLRQRLADAKMVVVEEGTEIGFDDWQGADGKPAEVVCWWSVWAFSTINTI